MSKTVNEPSRSAGNTRMEIAEYISVNGLDIPIDMHGYLTNPKDWDVEVALKQAELANVEMTDDHWFVVNYIREQYEYSSCVPEARHALKSMKEHLGKERATRKYLYKLFPYGYAIQACRIAGTRVPLKIMLDL
ncbi:TusE/DsrC/DsvC family sulfur relay protein [uncultured Cocleimonas sp.]|uniref:TusE/DsrC/DsvC family sulfur relay protein n=1 Tax=uncultured Cocleimonas sp. TaxID=1051587 RepID=UPI00262C9B1E|nr:TusE/DsrC/DsvC family sulfur relay protein [uncultured Cocleimonas sp.]